MVPFSFCRMLSDLEKASIRKKELSDSKESMSMFDINLLNGKSVNSVEKKIWNQLISFTINKDGIDVKIIILINGKLI